MSAPDVNVKRQKKRHRPAVWGIWISVAVVVVAGVAAIAYFT